MSPATNARLRIAVVGTGISGLSAAWLLSRRHDVTVYEQDGRAGGHSNTVDVAAPGGRIAVDTGFIVYNPLNYPNLAALFEYFGVPTRTSEMSFSVSRGGGALEYAGTSLDALFAQRKNVLSPRFWSMLMDLRRFYRNAPRHLAGGAGQEGEPDITLGAYLTKYGYGETFRDDHLLPMAAAIWSAPAKAMAECSALAFIRFFENHGLLLLRDRPEWRTVVGGSRTYVDALSLSFRNRIRYNAKVASVARTASGVDVTEADGTTVSFDHAVFATHSDEALALLRDPAPEEKRLLGAIRYRKNQVVLHGDPDFMPKRRKVWSSWNYVHTGDAAAGDVNITYWMNRLQSLPRETPLFVTLDPKREPRAIFTTHDYAHPVFDAEAYRAQQQLWTLQGVRNTWFCGAYFGAGFHEDGLQAGLAVAEDLGGVRRPWKVADDSARIVRHPVPGPRRPQEAA